MYTLRGARVKWIEVFGHGEEGRQLESHLVQPVTIYHCQPKEMGAFFKSGKV